jgi:hypothetical protein
VGIHGEFDYENTEKGWRVANYQIVFGEAIAAPPQSEGSQRDVPEQPTNLKQLNVVNVAVGAWYGILNWEDGTVNKQEIIFNSDLTVVRNRASDRSSASNWGDYPVQKDGNTLRWQIPGPGRTTILTFVADRSGQFAKASCQIVQQGRVSHTAAGEFGRNDVSIP